MNKKLIHKKTTYICLNMKSEKVKCFHYPMLENEPKRYLDGQKVPKQLKKHLDTQSSEKISKYFQSKKTSNQSKKYPISLKVFGPHVKS